MSRVSNLRHYESAFWARVHAKRHSAKQAQDELEHKRAQRRERYGVPHPSPPLR